MFVKSVIAGLLFGIIAYFYVSYYKVEKSEKDKIEQNIILSWKNNVHAPATQFKKLAVGINSNVDYIVRGVDLLKKLGLSPGKMEDHDLLSSLDELQETFSYFFNKGSAAERVYLESKLFQQIREAAENLEEIEQYIGGNAALMASKTAEMYPDIEILFVGPVGPQLRTLMPDVIQIPKSSHISSDEVHLIMEYKVGDVWGDFQAPVANRFISSYDVSNSQLTMLDTFFEASKSYKPDLMVLSGLHLLDGQSERVFNSKISVLVDHLQTVDSNIPVHLEFASMINIEFINRILHKVLPNINSLGLNEQELFISSASSAGPHPKEYLTHGQPEIHKVTDIMVWLLSVFGHSETNRNSRLTRIHFHSLTFHIIGTVGKFWGNLKSAVAAGTEIAGQQACDVQELSSSIVDIQIPLRYKLYTGDEERAFNSSEPVTVFTKEGFNFAFSPVLVCNNPTKTVGLGDAISATGLMFSEFNAKSS